MAKREKLTVLNPPEKQKQIEDFVKSQPKKPKRVRKPISAYISPETHKKLKLYAAEHEKEISEVIEDAVLRVIESA